MTFQRIVSSAPTKNDTFHISFQHWPQQINHGGNEKVVAYDEWVIFNVQVGLFQCSGRMTCSPCSSLKVNVLKSSSSCTVINHHTKLVSHLLNLWEIQYLATALISQRRNVCRVTCLTGVHAILTKQCHVAQNRWRDLFCDSMEFFFWYKSLSRGTFFLYKPRYNWTTSMQYL